MSLKSRLLGQLKSNESFFGDLLSEELPRRRFFFRYACYNFAMTDIIQQAPKKQILLVEDEQFLSTLLKKSAGERRL